MELYSPYVLLLLLLLPVMAYRMLRKKAAAAVKFPSLADMRTMLVSWRLRLRPLLALARLACLALLIVAMARPRQGTVRSEISTEGVAIEVVVDRSSSMQAEMDHDGQKLNRLEVVKKVFADFIQGGKKGLRGRRSDLVGLITFARYADTKCPLVHSHDILVEFLNQTELVKVRSEDGTAIGDAIALGGARLEKAEEEIQKRNMQLRQAGLERSDIDEEPGFKIKSKVMILLTDGQNNVGRYSPIEAAKLAKEWGIKIYTIGIGSAQAFRSQTSWFGTHMVPVGQELDERLLKAIAESTGGFYALAGDAAALREIVKKIDDLEKTTVKSVQYTQYAERFGPWTKGALLMLALEILGSCTIFRKIP